MSQHSDPHVRVGDLIVGRCVTMNDYKTGKVAVIVVTPSEYTTRFKLDTGHIVFFQGYPESRDPAST